MTGRLEWNAERYHHLSSPQQTWGSRVLERLALEGHEQVLDLGCGTGRVTGELAQRVPRGRVVALDRSPAMLATARDWLRARPQAVPLVSLVNGDGAALPFRRAF